MDLKIHDRIIWNACLLARQLKTPAAPKEDPLCSFGAFSRGSWMNDTNQVTCFTDLLKAGDGGGGQEPPTATLDDAVRTVLHQYWEIQKDRLLSSLQDAHVRAANVRLLDQLHDTSDFGSYSCFEHLDVLGEAPDAEGLEAGKAHQVAKTIDRTLEIMHRRLGRGLAGDRWAPLALSQLGRVLHTLADFFAHSNYVELLLWELSRRHAKELRPIADYFNRRTGAYPFEPALDEGFYTPLPAEGARPEPREGLYPLLWYGDAPATTPLASCVFDLQDTAYTLVTMYARYLEKARPAITTEQELNCLFAVLDMSGAPIPYALVRSAVGLSERVRAVLDDLGRGARRFLVTTLLGIGKRSTTNPSVRALLDTTGALLQQYDSKEAGEWARAGRLRYCAHAVQLDLAERLASHAGDKLSPLPHHTLLCKDYPAPEPDAALRFELACLLATAVSAKLLEAYLGNGPAGEVYEWLRRKVLVHPSKAMDGGSVDGAALARFVGRSFGRPWSATGDAAILAGEVLRA